MELLTASQFSSINAYIIVPMQGSISGVKGVMIQTLNNTHCYHMTIYGLIRSYLFICHGSRTGKFDLIIELKLSFFTIYEKGPDAIQSRAR